MKTTEILTITLLIIGINCFAQDAKKMNKYLTVFASDKFDPKASVSFERKNPDKHGWDEISMEFKNAFALNGFKVDDAPKYAFVMDYGYKYVISQYRMQYRDLKGQIVDLSNNKEVVGTFNYNGRFETNLVPDAIAKKLKK